MHLPAEVLAYERCVDKAAIEVGRRNADVGIELPERATPSFRRSLLQRVRDAEIPKVLQKPEPLERVLQQYLPPVHMLQRSSVPRGDRSQLDAELRRHLRRDGRVGSESLELEAATKDSRRHQPALERLPVIVLVLVVVIVGIVARADPIMPDTPRFATTTTCELGEIEKARKRIGPRS
jgi:hypothetical protein